MKMRALNDTDINMRCPESFKLEKMEIIEEDTQRFIDTTPDEERDGYSVNGKKLVPYVCCLRKDEFQKNNGKRGWESSTAGTL